jgi:Mn-dependent DtxR family transcriptional regulator
MGPMRAWKGHDWDVLNRLHESGYIDDPVSKAKSVVLTDDGAERSRRLFEKHFMKG